MAKRVLSIEIGARSTKLSEVSYIKGTPNVHKCVSIPTPQGAVEDGYIRDKNMFATVLRQALADANIKTREVIFTVNSTKVANREVLIPAVKEQTIKSIVMNQATEYFPIDISEYTISYYILSRVSNGKDKQIKLLVLAAPVNLIRGYYGLADALEMQVESIDYIGNSYFQIAKKQVGQGVSIAVHINENSSIINIIENESLMLQRIIPYGANGVIEAVQKHSTFKVTTSEEAVSLLCREKIINHQFDLAKEDGVTYAVASEGYEKIMKEARAREDVTQAFKFVVSNVIRVLDYFSSKNPEKKISFIHLSGIGSRFMGVAQLFHNELGLDAKKMEDLFSIRFDKNALANPAESSEFLACIGACVKPIGFEIHDDKMKAGNRGTTKGVMLGASACMILTTGLILVSVFANIGYAAKKRQLENDIASRSSVEVIYNEYNKVLADYNTLAGVYDSTRNANENLDKLIGELEEKLPKAVSVTALSITDTNVSLTITLDKTITVAKLLMQLQQIDCLDKISIDSTNTSDVDDGPATVSIIVNAVYTQDAFDKLVDTDSGSVDNEATGAETTEQSDNTEVSAE
ncbi:pilus assembly protein PilM [Anaeromicropila populeti]|uniref:Type IV pilus assembly protein PilM n=1 Tax=Anaeromicropila populeti TaxID=37658 RepID=A0A1I6INZ3_9FIRM|nr:pilus assembly protein PilM [Anaeromicropila populeti]SFR68453.1 type IV pilus assembly protein PilM [Anaeromicropila populeti]